MCDGGILLNKIKQMVTFWVFFFSFSSFIYIANLYCLYGQFLDPQEFMFSHLIGWVLNTDITI